MAANLGTAFVRVRGDLSHLQAQLVSTLAPTKLNRLAKGAGLAIGAGLVAGGAGKGLFDLGKNFDAAFDNIRTSTGATGDALDELQDDFKGVVKTLPTDFDSAGDAVAGLNQRLGLTGEPLRKLARQILQFSRITGTDVAENVAAITRLFGDWSVASEDQAVQMDKLFRLTQKTGIGLDDLARLMVKFGSPLRTLGFDFEEAAAMFGRFEREGVNLQTTLPGFKIALKNFAKPTEELGAKFKKFGVDAEEPRKALRQVFELLKTLPRREGTQLAFEVFGSRAASDMFRAVKEGRFEFQDLLDVMDKGSDTINKAERDTRDFAEQWQLLKNRIFVGLEPVASAFFKSIGDGMEALAQADFDRIGGDISKSLDLGKVDFSGVGDSLRGSIQSIKSIVQSDLAQLLGEGLLGTLRKQAAAIGQVFRGMGNVIAGTLKLIDDLIHLRLGDAFKDLGQIFKGGTQVAVGALRLMTAPVREIAARVGRALLVPFRSAWNSVKDIFQKGVSGTLSVLRGMAGVASDIGRRVGTALAAGFRARINLVRGVADDIVGIVKRIPGRLGGVFRTIGRVVEPLLDLLKKIVRGAEAVVRAIGKIKPPKIKLPDITPGFDFPGLAKGGFVRDKLALVGEEGFELAKLPGGKMTLLGQEGPELRDLPVGTRVYSHPETKQKLASLTQKVIQKLVPASLRAPEPLVQPIVQEALGTESGKQSLGPLLSKPLEAPTMARPQGFKVGGVVKISREEARKRQRGQPPEAAESGKRRDKDLEATKSSKATGSGRAIQQRAERLDRAQLPYVWGGNHGLPYNLKEGFDCSSAVSYVLGISPRVSGQLAGYGKPGKGPVSIFANAKHTFMSVFGRGFGTSKENPGGGPGWISYNARPGFTVSYLAGVHTPGKEEGGVGKPRAFRNLSLGQYITVAKQVGFPDPALAAAIFYAESRGKVNAVGDSGESLGAAQIHTPSHPKYDHKKLRDDVFYNFRAALEISKKGRNFQPWTQYRNSAYKQFMGGKARPLPKSVDRGEGSSSTLADYIELRRTQALDTLSPKDDLRWINRALRYWRGVYRRNKRAGNIKRQTEALKEIQTLKEERLTLKEAKEEPELFTLGDLSTIGTGPNAFNIAGMQSVLDQIDLEKAQASLTLPRDDDASQAGIAASLQDDIAAAKKLVSVRESLHTLTQGFRMPSRPLTEPFDPTPAQTKQLNKTKTPQERIALLNRFIAEATQGPFIVGTIKQKIEAATDLATARSELKNLTDEAGKKEETPEAAEKADVGSGDATSLFALISELFKQYGSNIIALPKFAKGGISRLPFALVGEEGPEIVRLPAGSKVHSNPESQRMAKQMGIPAFREGGVIQPTQATPREIDMEKFVKQLVTAIRENPGEVHKHIDARSYFRDIPADPHTWSRDVSRELGVA